MKKGTKMSDRLQSVKSRLAEIVQQMKEGYDGNLTIPIGFEEMQAINGAVHRAMQEKHGPRDLAYLDLAGELIGQLIKRRQELTNPPLRRIYQFKVILRGNENVWRRIQVEDEALRDFRNQLMRLGHWVYEELYGFQIGSNDYVHADSVSWDDVNMEGVMLSEALGDCRPPSVDLLTRDCEDWLQLVFEGCCDRDDGQKYPRCLEGAGAIPSEHAMQLLIAAEAKQDTEPAVEAKDLVDAPPMADTVNVVDSAPFSAEAATITMQR